MTPELKESLKKYVYDIIGVCQTVHTELGPYLNEYIYQEALEIEFANRNIPVEKEYYFKVEYKGTVLNHKHYFDFLCKDKVILECKAIEQLGDQQRQQLWNYMRLSSTRIGLLVNFAPIRSQIERYYYDPDTKQICAF